MPKAFPEEFCEEAARVYKGLRYLRRPGRDGLQYLVVAPEAGE